MKIKNPALILVILLAYSAAYAQSAVMVKDINSTVDKWSANTEVGYYVIKDGKSVITNNKAKFTDTKDGVLSVGMRGVRKNMDHSLFLYSPYMEGKNIVTDGQIKVSIPHVQNGQCAPVNFGRCDFKGGNANVLNIDIAARNACIVIKLSSKCTKYNDWRLEKITLSSQYGIFSGEASLNVSNGRLVPRKDGNVFNNVSYVPDSALYVGDKYTNINLMVLPCKKIEGKPLRLEYTFSKNGQKEVLCHDVIGMNVAAGSVYTFEERIPEVLVGRWHLYDYPGEDWDAVQPETLGYSSAKLEDLRNYLKDSCSTTSMMIVTGGKVIFSYGDVAENVKIASCRKSLISMLYGKYVENGTINLESTLEELGIDDKGGLLPIERKATVRNLITARSGVYHPASNDGDDQKYAPKRGSVKPGTYHLYNNWDFNCAGAVFEQLTGKDIYDAFMEDIAIPVGMQDYKIDNQHKKGITYPTQSYFLAYHFWISTRDMARIAYLMLHKGAWNGTQVISEDWVKTTTSTFTPRAEMNPASRHKKEFDYGYLWWVFCKEYKGFDPSIYSDGYTATGLGGQYITVLPALDMVIAHKDKTQRTQKSDYYKLIARVANCRL